MHLIQCCLAGGEICSVGSVKKLHNMKTLLDTMHIKIVKRKYNIVFCVRKRGHIALCVHLIVISRMMLETTGLQ